MFGFGNTKKIEKLEMMVGVLIDHTGVLFSQSNDNAKAARKKIFIGTKDEKAAHLAFLEFSPLDTLKPGFEVKTVTPRNHSDKFIGIEDAIRLLAEHQGLEFKTMEARDAEVILDKKA